MRPARMALAVALGLVCAPAHATTGLAWQVPGPLRYHLDLKVTFPDLMWLVAEKNVEVRVVEAHVSLVTTCTPDDVWKRGWELACRLDDLAIRAAPIDSESGRALPVLEEWDALLTGRSVSMELTSDGRVRSIDLDDVEMGIEDRRTNAIREAMRIVFARAFAAFDLQLPKKGDDGGLGTWRQRESVTMWFPSSAGTVGSAVIEHVITPGSGEVVEISTRGKGVLAPATTVSSPTGSSGADNIANYFDMTLTGSARFDPAQGRLLSRDYEARGTLTASSIDASGRAGYDYIQIVRLRWLSETDPMPDLGPTAELEPIDRPTTPR